MMMNKKTLYVAVAASFGMFAASQANAAPVSFATEIPAGSDIAAPVWAVPVTSFAPTTANPLYLQFSLTGGASFDTMASASLVCTAVCGGVTGTLTPANVQLVAGGVGTANATFIVTAITAGALTVGCTLTNGTAHIGTWPASVSENVVLTYGGNLAPTGSNSTALATAASMFTNSITAGTTTALVVSGFVSFGVNAAAGTNATTARAGQFTLALNTNALATGGAANAIAGTTGFVTAVTITVGGLPLASSPISTASVFITMSTAAGSAVCNGGTIAVSALGGTSSITFSAIAPSVAGAGSAAINYAVCMSVTGGTMIPAGAITVGVTGVPNTDPNNAAGSAFQISTLIAAGTTVGNITRNGQSTEVLNLPPSTNADAGYLRVYNNSPAAGAVTVTVYNEAGTALATNCALGTVASQSTLVSSVASIETTCAFTPAATGRYRMVVSGAMSTMRAQGLARTAGVLVNLSGDTSGNGTN